jgi:hypothetical protein
LSYKKKKKEERKEKKKKEKPLLCLILRQETNQKKLGWHKHFFFLTAMEVGCKDGGSTAFSSMKVSWGGGDIQTHTPNLGILF